MCVMCVNVCVCVCVCVCVSVSIVIVPQFQFSYCYFFCVAKLIDQSYNQCITTGITVHLKYPYSRHCDEDHMYLDIVTHAVSKLTDRGSMSLRRLGSTAVKEEPSPCVSFPVSTITYFIL